MTKNSASGDITLRVRVDDRLGEEFEFEDELELLVLFDILFEVC